jgi:predicted Kef-type K+ transport protein
MFRQGPLPPFVHGLLDYLVGVTLIAAPFVLGFDEDTGTAASVVLGVVLLIVAASTDLPTGLVRSIPRALHVFLDYLIALALVAAPFVLGFSDDGTAAPWLIATGVVQLLHTLATRFLRPKDSGPRQ